MARRHRLVDSVFIVFAVLSGAAIFSVQARTSELPEWAVTAYQGAALATVLKVG